MMRQVFFTEWWEHFAIRRQTLRYYWWRMRPHRLAILDAERQVTFSRIAIIIESNFEKWRSLHMITQKAISSRIATRIQSNFGLWRSIRMMMQLILSEWQQYCAIQIKVGELQQHRTRQTTRDVFTDWWKYLAVRRWTLQHCWRCMRPYKMAILHAERKVTSSRIYITIQASFGNWRSLRMQMLIQSCVSRLIHSFQVRMSLNLVQRILSKWQKYCAKCSKGLGPFLWKLMDRKAYQQILDIKTRILMEKSHPGRRVYRFPLTRSITLKQERSDCDSDDCQVHDSIVPPVHATKDVSIYVYLPRTKLVKDKLYPSFQRQSKRRLPNGKSILLKDMPPGLCSSSEERTILSKSDNDSDSDSNHPHMLGGEIDDSDEPPGLRSTSESESENDSYLNHPRMLGGGIDDSDEPLVPPVDADSMIRDEMALELEKALARSRKNKPNNPENALRNEKARQQYESKLKFDKTMFSLNRAESDSMEKDLTYPAATLKFDYTMSKADNAKMYKKQQLKYDNDKTKALKEDEKQRHKMQLKDDSDKKKALKENEKQQHKKQLKDDSDMKKALKEDEKRQHKKQLKDDKDTKKALEEDEKQQHKKQLKDDKAAKKALEEDEKQQQKKQLKDEKDEKKSTLRG